MAVNEGLQPVAKDQQIPIDPNVRVPDHVRRAAEAADAIHRQAYEDPEAAAAAAAAAEAARVAAEAEAARVAAEANSQTQREPDQQTQPPAGNDFTGPADPQSLQGDEWARRYNSMHGRWQASERARAAMEAQMAELGQELVRTQHMLTQVQTQPNQQQAPTDHGNLITDEDRANYGEELIDLARRAALSSVSPQIAQLQEENKRLTSQVKNTSKREMFMQLDRSLANWREINKSVQFKSWLRLPNIYTGQLRGQMLQAAVDGAEAPKIIQLFRDFLSEANATGHMVPQVQAEQQPQLAAPHAPALSLETLAAPGRARPASGDTQVPGEKPIYSRAQISKFYDDKRRGLYAGRDADVQAFEADLTAAQREGRIR